MKKMNTAFMQELIEDITRKNDKHNSGITGALLALYLTYLSMHNEEVKKSSIRQTDEEIVAELQALVNE